MGGLALAFSPLPSLVDLSPSDWWDEKWGNKMVKYRHQFPAIWTNENCNAFDDCSVHCQWRSSTHCFFRWGIHHDCVGSICIDHVGTRSWNLNPHCLLWTGCNFSVGPQKKIPSSGVGPSPCLPAIDVVQHAFVSEKQGFSVLEPRIWSHWIWVSFNSI